MSDTANQVLFFHTTALPNDTFHLYRLDAVEGLSRPYVIELELLSEQSTIELSSVIGKRARVGIKQGVPLAGGTRRGVKVQLIHGIVRSFEVAEERQDLTRYRAVLEPTISLLKLNHRSRSFQQKTIKEIITAILVDDYSLAEGTDFEFRLGAKWYPNREYVLQYQETDFAFISRWLEHEGVFYFFEQTESGERIVFADSTAAYRPMQVHPLINYRPQADQDSRSAAAESDAASEDWFGEEVVSLIRGRHDLLPKDVLLRDYNYREVRDLACEAKAADHGFGTHYEYNEHFKGEGNDLAAVRAEEIRGREFVFEGKSDCRSFHAGAIFELVDHFRHDMNAEYVIVEVRHTAQQAVALASSNAGGRYSNEFVAIHASTVFRPARATEWPAIRGVMHGIVTQSVDDQGRYKIRLPFDITHADSRWIRMAQPYTGNGYGMHLRLHVGTEVIVTHIDGDPDRPIIAGAVPNPQTGSVVTAKNIVKNIIRSRSGNAIVFDDTPGADRVVLRNGTGNAVWGFRNLRGGGSGRGEMRTMPPSARSNPATPATSATADTSATGGALPPQSELVAGPFAAMSPHIGGSMRDSTGAIEAPDKLWLSPNLNVGPFTPLAVGAGASGADDDEMDEDEFFADVAGQGHSQSDFHTWLSEIYAPGASAAKANAATFSGEIGSYGYNGEFALEVLKGFSGSYHLGNLKEIHIGDVADSYVNVKEINEHVETDGGNSLLIVRQANTSGDQIIAEGMCEHAAVKRVWNVLDTEATGQRTLDSSTLAAGTVKEELKCKNVNETTTILENQTASTTVGGNVTETTSVTGNVSETTTISGNQSGTTTISGNVTETTNVTGNVTETTNVTGSITETTNCSDITSTTDGVSTEFYFGRQHSLFFGGSVEVDIAGKFSFALSAELETKIGLAVELALAGKLEAQLGGAIELFLGKKIESTIGSLTKFAFVSTSVGLNKTKLQLKHKTVSLLDEMGLP